MARRREQPIPRDELQVRVERFGRARRRGRAIQGKGSSRFLLLAATLLVAVLVASLGAGRAQATPGSILIYGPSLLGAPDNEQTLATAAGHTVTVANAATWSSMTSAQFASFDAIVFGDPSCSGSPGVLAAAEANKATWSAAVRGNVVVIGSDPVLHQFQGSANTLTTNAINFAAGGGGTGLYVSLSCYYAGSPANTPVSLLSEFGTFAVQGQSTPPLNGCPNDVEIVDSSSPVVAGITAAGLSNWGCSIHEAFNTYPSFLSVVARDNPTDLPYILAGTLNQPPDCTAAVASPSLLWPPNHKLETVTVMGVTDPDGDPVTVTITRVTQDEPTNGLGDGNRSPDAQPDSTSDSVRLRGERSGRGDGRVYRIHFTATDPQGASCSGTVTVGVPHDKGTGPAIDSAPPSYNSFLP
jgi:hypothetical protein